MLGMTEVGNGDGLALWVDASGRIAEVLEKLCSVALPAGFPFAQIFDDASRDKAEHFLDGVRERGAAVDWELVMWVRGRPEVLWFAGQRVEDRILVAATSGPDRLFDHFTAARRQAAVPDSLAGPSDRLFADGRAARLRDPDLLDDLAALTNQLAAAHRELEKRNACLEQALTSLDDARRAAEAASRDKSSLLRFMLHDLNQPLTAQKLLLHRLDEEPQTEIGAKLMAGLKQTTGALEAMCGAIDELAVLQSGKMTAHVETLDLHTLLTGLVAEFAPVAERTGVALRLRSADLTVRSDRVLLARILRNLLANAFRYTERGGVLLASRRRGAAVRIEIWDTGPGIPEVSRNAIFDEFYRQPETAHKPGLGLGLTVVTQLAHLLDHPIALRSRPGSGSAFMVTVPGA